MFVCLFVCFFLFPARLRFKGLRRPVNQQYVYPNRAGIVEEKAREEGVVAACQLLRTYAYACVFIRVASMKAVKDLSLMAY